MFTFRSTELARCLGRRLAGEYAENGTNHGQKVYKRTASAWLVLPTGAGAINSLMFDRSSNIEELFLYYFDDGEDPQSVGAAPSKLD